MGKRRAMPKPDPNDDWYRLPDGEPVKKRPGGLHGPVYEKPGLVIRGKGALPPGSMLRRALEDLEKEKKSPKNPPKKKQSSKKSGLSVKSPNGVWNILGTGK